MQKFFLRTSLLIAAPLVLIGVVMSFGLVTPARAQTAATSCTAGNVLMWSVNYPVGWGYCVTSTLPAGNMNPVAIREITGAPITSSTYSTNVVLALSSPIPNIASVAIANDNTILTNPIWQDFGITKNWSLVPLLPGQGQDTRTVNVQFKDMGGSISPVYTVRVILQYGSTSSIQKGVTSCLTGYILQYSANYAPGTGYCVVASTLITDSSSPVGVTPPTKVNYAPGELMAFSYRYKNDAFDSMTLNIRRELVYKNRTIKTVSASKVIKAGSTARIAVKEALAKNLKPGQYLMRIKMFDERGRLVASNGVKFVVAPK